MLRNRMLSCSAWIVFAVFLGGCGGSQPGPRAYRSLQFTLSTNKALYSAGEPVHFTFLVTNVSDAGITGYIYNGRFTVIRLFKDGAIFFDEAVSAVVSTDTFAILGRETVTAGTDLPAGQAGVPNPLPPGQYTLYVGFWAKSFGDETQTHPEYDPRLYAQPVTFTIK